LMKIQVLLVRTWSTLKLLSLQWLCHHQCYFAVIKKPTPLYL
jgi:hypothetical protein